MTERAVLPPEDRMGENGFQQQEKDMSKLDVNINALMEGLLNTGTGSAKTAVD